MITRMRITEIHAQRLEDAQGSGFEVLFNVEDVKIDGNDMKIKFAYLAKYAADSGSIQIKGIIQATEDAETIKKISDELKKGKLPSEYMQKLVNNVNYFGTTNATIIASVMNLSPPMKLPVLSFGSKEKEKKK